MSCKEELLFFKEWVCYLKGGKITYLKAVLKRSPTNLPELSFLLEITTQLCILKALGSTLNTKLERPVSFALASFTELQSIGDVLTAQYIRQLIALHSLMKARLRNVEKQSTITSILIGVLSSTSQPGSQEVESECHRYFRSIGKWYFLFASQQNSKDPLILREIKDRWSFRKLVGPEWRENLVDLLIIWSAFQIQLTIKNQSIGQTKLKIQQNSENLIYQWFDGITYQLSNCSILKHLSEDDLIKISEQSKNIVKRLRIKDRKDKRFILVQLKNKMLQNAMNKQHFKQKAVIFGYHFTIMTGLCAELDEKIETIVNLKDLIQKESIFYSNFWQLSKMDYIRYFSPFSAYMRQFSQYSILQIYRKINCNLNITESYAKLDPIDILQMVQEQNRVILRQFNIQPANISKILLEHYLQKSGIPLPKTHTIHNGKRSRLNAISTLVPDPLHFMMISNKFWEDNFHRGLLEIALWMTLDFYCRWFASQSIKQASQKQIQEYLKKLNLAITIFCFSLNYPTCLLQYLPVQSDCLKQLFCQSVFPSLVLKSKYFFKSYRWGSRQIVPKNDSGLENWVLPWGHLLTVPKNMLHFVYLDRGYELAYLLASQNRAGFQRTFGDFFATKILAQLQGLGINLSNGEAEAKQKVLFIHPQRKKYMILLLRESEKCGEKVGHTVRRILQKLT